MRMVKLLIFAAFAIFAFAAAGTAMASAEDGAPEVLCLVAECIKEQSGHFESEKTPTLETLGGLRLIAATALVLLKNCKPLEKPGEKDTNLCEDQEYHLKSAEEPAKKLKCKSESTNGQDKDVNGEVLALLDVYVMAELNLAKTELQPLLLVRVLGPLLESTLLIKCGIINFKVKGTFGCLLTLGLLNVGAGRIFEVACEINKTTHDAETGECELLCEWLKEFPFESSNLKGESEMAWEDMHLKGSFNEDVFIDD